MFQLLKEPRFDFMAKRRLLLPVSIVFVLAAVCVLVMFGLNLGIEFTGGTELQVRYAERPDLPAIRSALSAAGMTGQVVTTIGEPEDNEVYIRLAVEANEAKDPTGEVLDALHGLASGSAERGVDLNIEDQATLVGLLRGVPELGADQAERLAERLLEQRKEQAIFRTLDDLASLEGMTPGVLDYLRDNATIGPLALRSQSFIGPAVGRELVRKAVIAIIGSLIGMLVYIWIRFQLQWGFAAVVALTHDTLITLGLFSIFQQEMSLPVVAAFLTLIGYSVNDTVVVFDRIRENLESPKPGEALADIINRSINQTLSRTIITSGLTWVVVLGLFLFGGQALRPFSFVLTVGVLVGTYSSIYVASPILVLWKALQDARRQRSGEAGSPGPRRTRKAGSGSG